MIIVNSNNAAFKTLANTLAQLDMRNQRFAIAVALTRTAKIAQEELKSKISSTFDRPNPYTLNSTFVQTATKANLRADIKIKDTITKGKAAGKNQPNRFLGPQVFAGGRQLKGIEKKLAAIDPEFAGMITPTKNTPLDSYGNPSRGIYNKVVAGLVNKGKTSKGRTAKTIFVVQKGGIYQIDRSVKTSGRGDKRQVKITNTNVQRMFNIINRATYKKRLDFYGIVQKSVENNFRDQLAIAIRLARETAR